jgi:hypothetical protein
MCNLYSITTNQAAIIALFRVINHHVGNLPPMPGVLPDYPAPVVRDDGGGREMVTMRWGMPPPPRAGGYPVTNIRNTSSPRWRGWLKPQSRCLDRVQGRLTGWGAPPAHAGAAAVLDVRHHLDLDRRRQQRTALTTTATAGDGDVVRWPAKRNGAPLQRTRS